MSQTFHEMQNMVDFDARAEKVLSQEPILSAQNVEVTFSLRGKMLKAIRGASLDLYEGETLAIVGESGSGKSVFTKLFVCTDLLKALFDFRRTGRVGAPVPE